METSKQPGMLASEQPHCQPDSSTTASLDRTISKNCCVTATITDPRGDGDLKFRQLNQVSLKSFPIVPTTTNPLRMQCSATPKFYPAWMTIPQSRAQEEKKEDPVAIFAIGNSPANEENQRQRQTVETHEVAPTLMENALGSSGRTCRPSADPWKPSQDQCVTSKVPCGSSGNQHRLTGETGALRVRCDPEAYESSGNQCGITGDPRGLSSEPPGNQYGQCKLSRDQNGSSEEQCVLPNDQRGLPKRPDGQSRDQHEFSEKQTGPLKDQYEPLSQFRQSREQLEPSKVQEGLTRDICVLSEDQSRPSKDPREPIQNQSGLPKDRCGLLEDQYRLAGDLCEPPGDQIRHTGIQRASPGTQTHLWRSDFLLPPHYPFQYPHHYPLTYSDGPQVHIKTNNPYEMYPVSGAYSFFHSTKSLQGDQTDDSQSQMDSEGGNLMKYVNGVCQGSITTDYVPQQTVQKNINKALRKEETNTHNRKNGDRTMSERTHSKNSRMFERFTNALRKVLDDDLVEATDSNESDEESSPRSDTIKIRGVANEVTAAKCEYYFQNPDRGGGDIQATEWDNNENTFYITFKDTNVAKRVVSSVHTIGDWDMEVSLAHRRLHGQMATRTVEVSGCDLQLKDVYVLYFENPRHGGGAISSVHEDKKNEKLFITFEEAEVAETVCCTKHKVRDRVLEVKLASLAQTTDTTCGSEQDDDVCLKTLEVTTGQHLKTEDEYLHYFQHYGHGYGGKVEDFTLDKENGKLLVTFDTVKVAKRVAEKTHNIKGQKVEATLVKAAPYYKNKLLLKNVAEVTTKEHLLIYIECVSGKDKMELLYSYRLGNVLVTFQETPDFKRIKVKCQRKPLDGNQLEVCMVPVSNCLLVENLSPSTTDDEVARYFESPRANGGTVLRVKLTPEKGKYLVFFEDAGVIEGVVTTEHRLAGKKIKVNLYLECLGLLGGSADPFVFVFPEPLKLNSEDNIKVCFVQQCRETLKLFNQHLAGVCARGKVTKDVLTIECTLSKSMPGVHRLLCTWHDDVQRNLNTCFETVGLRKLNVTPEIWPTLKQAVEKSSILNRQGTMVLPLAGECSYVVMGSSSIEEVFQRISSMVKSIQNDTERKKHEVTKSEVLQTFELDLLRLWPLVTEEEQRDGLAVDIRPDKGIIYFRGLLEEILGVQVKMFRALRSIASQKLKGLEESKCLVLVCEEARDTIDRNLKTAGVIATWECTDKRVITVYCLNKDDISQAVSIIKTSVREDVLHLNELSCAVVVGQGWKNLEANLQRKYPGVLGIRTENKSIRVTSLQQILPTAIKTIANFISENTVYSTVFRFSSSRHKFVNTFWTEKLSEVGTKLSKNKVQIAPESNKKGISVQGTRKGIKVATEELQKMEAAITCSHEIVRRKEDIMYLTRLNSMKELDAFASSHRCVISLFPENNGVQIVSTDQPSENQIRVGSDHTVSVVQEDITQLQVDAIVNAANEHMQHIGGLAKHIVSKGGKEIQEDCNLILKTRGKLSEGDVLVSGPGKLPCKSIIHAVGPRYKGGNKGEEECLRDTVMECLKTASELEYTSIAIPAISSGVFGYPLEEATRVIVEAVSRFFDNNPNSSIKDVRLSDILRDTVNNFRSALIMYSYQMPPLTQTAFQSGLLNTYQEIKVSLVEGEIEMQKVDVIVNSTAANLQLKSGSISSSIAKAAGPGLQRECLLRYPDGIAEGEIACTGGHNLACKAIFHVSLCEWTTEGAREKLQSIIEICLKEASIHQFSTIAIPALGTGVLGFARDVVAHVTLTTIHNFSRTFPETSLKEVIVVILDDEETMQAFHTETNPAACEKSEEVLTSLSNQFCFEASSNELEEVSMPSEAAEIDDFVREHPLVAVPSVSALWYAEKRASKGVVFPFHGLTLTVKEGDITEEDVDIIVNSTNAKLDLSQVAEIRHKKLALTESYNLKCRWILHINAQSYSWSTGHPMDCCQAFHDLLQEADRIGVQSIALPALGTGHLSVSPHDSAEDLKKALIRYASGRKCVQRVTVVLRDSDVMKHFTDVLLQTSSTTSTSQANKVPNYGSIADSREAFPEPIPDTVSLYIFTLDRKSVHKILKSFSRFVDEQFTQKTINDLSKLSDDQLQRTPAEGITLKGLRGDIEFVSNEITDIQKRTEQQRVESVTAKLVQWCYFKKTLTGLICKPYDKKENLVIEHAYQLDREKTVSIEDQGTIFVIDFRNKRVYSQEDKTIVYDITRKEIIEDFSMSMSILPNTWEPLKDEPFKLVDLPKESPEYSSVRGNLFETIGKRMAEIISIQRVQNPELYLQYTAKKAHMIKDTSRKTLERILWHGTSQDSVRNINRYGFNRSCCGKNATCYGDGVYFAVSSAYSLQHKYTPKDFDDRRYIYQCKVLTGHYTQGCEGMAVLPKRFGQELFDSATNNVAAPSMFVIFHDAQAYPEYLITFE